MECHSPIIANANGLIAKITNYGGIIVRILVPDRAGRLADVNLGFGSVEAYAAGGYYGALVGRYANRIAAGRFSLDGKTFQLATNSETGPLDWRQRTANAAW